MRESWRWFIERFLQVISNIILSLISNTTFVHSSLTYHRQAILITHSYFSKIIDVFWHLNFSNAFSISRGMAMSLLCIVFRILWWFGWKVSSFVYNGGVPCTIEPCTIELCTIGKIETGHMTHFSQSQDSILAIVHSEWYNEK